jgi:hypothetical protein
LDFDCPEVFRALTGKERNLRGLRRRARKASVNEAEAMTNDAGRKRTDSAARVIRASPEVIYQAFLDTEAVVSWLPPNGMKGRIDAFEPREGGIFRMTLTYVGGSHSSFTDLTQRSA